MEVFSKIVSSQRRIQNPDEHLRRSFCQNNFTPDVYSEPRRISKIEFLLCYEFFYTLTIILVKEDINNVLTFLYLRKRKSYPHEEIY